MEISLKLDEILKERNMTQKELSEMTGIRPNTISEIVRNKKTVLNFKHLEIISTALNLKNINEIIKVDGMETKEEVQTIEQLEKLGNEISDKMDIIGVIAETSKDKEMANQAEFHLKGYEAIIWQSLN